MITLIDDQQVQALIDRRDALSVVELCYKAVASGTADVSRPAALSLSSRSGCKSTFKSKGAVLDEMNVAGFRLAADSNVPGGSDVSHVYLMNLHSAEPIALINVDWLHRLRTAATALAACRLLAPAQPAKLALIGTGRIAEEFVRIVGFCFPGLPVVVSSRSGERAQRAAQSWQALSANPLTATDNIVQAVADADIVVTLSDASERLFKATDLKPGALLCALGGQHEFDLDVLQAADHFVVDEIDFVCTLGNGAHWIRSGQITRTDLEQRLDATLGELLLGSKRLPGTGTVLAIVQGMAVCDIALAKLAYDRWTEINHR